MSSKAYIISETNEQEPIYSVDTALYLVREGTFRTYYAIYEVLKKGKTVSKCRPLGNEGNGTEILNSLLKF